ncbi:hypothetical protein JW766_05095 [Candidatus Dojkabacteria bacterium]|nr:hypothetical protein [Candidatus Dojkabacteria bacterium]
MEQEAVEITTVMAAAQNGLVVAEQLADALVQSKSPDTELPEIYQQVVSRTNANEHDIAAAKIAMDTYSNTGEWPSAAQLFNQLVTSYM